MGLRRLLLFVLALAGCASPGVEEYRAERPLFDLKQYFNGTVDAWGMFQDRSGKVVKRFKVVITCSWQGSGAQETGTLDEHFVYSDGTTQRRVWTLNRLPDGRWRGVAADVKGEAIGEIAGNALRWRYVLKLPVEGREYEVSLDDWMYLMDERTLINRSFMSKFGFEVGQITLFFSRRGS